MIRADLAFWICFPPRPPPIRLLCYHPHRLDNKEYPWCPTRPHLLQARFVQNVPSQPFYSNVDPLRHRHRHCRRRRHYPRMYQSRHHY